MSAEPVALGRLSQVALESQDRGTENNFRWFTVASSRKTKSKPTKRKHVRLSSTPVEGWQATGHVAEGVGG